MQKAVKSSIEKGFLDPKAALGESGIKMMNDGKKISTADSECVIVELKLRGKTQIGNEVLDNVRFCGVLSADGVLLITDKCNHAKLQSTITKIEKDILDGTIKIKSGTKMNDVEESKESNVNLGMAPKARTNLRSASGMASSGQEINIHL